MQASSWGERLPAISAGVTQLSNSFTNLTQRIVPVRVLPKKQDQRTLTSMPFLIKALYIIVYPLTCPEPQNAT